MSTKKLIGRIPISKGEYVAGNTYNRLSQVTLYGSTYQSKVDGNTSTPAILDDNGDVQHANTDQWLVIADGREAYNAGDRTSFFSKMEDPEGRMQITTDGDGKIMAYRDKDGVQYEHKLSVNHLELSDAAANEVNKAFKSAGIKMDNPSDFSKDSHIELPIPRISAQVRLYAPYLPTTKSDNIEAEIEYNDKDGNYFRKPVILNAQGSSSMTYYVKNMAIDIADGSEIKFGDFPTQDSFHLKKYYIDAFRGQCIVGYHLMEQVYKSRPIGEQYPYEQYILNDSTDNGLKDVKKDFFTGAKCHPDGFPIIITWVNSNTNEEIDIGIYTWNLKKSKEVYYCDKKKAENIILDGEIQVDTLFGGKINWSAFEIRNPKSLKNLDGSKYDGDNPKELSDTDELSKKVKDYIVRLSGFEEAINANKTKDTFKEYFLVEPFKDYFLVSNILFNYDGFRKNWIWCTWDGIHWVPTAYDMDSIFGSCWNGTCVETISLNRNLALNNVNNFSSLFWDEIVERYKELRDNGIFSVDNILNILREWINAIGYDNYKKELETLYPQTPSYREANIAKEWKLIAYASIGDSTQYDATTQYHIGDKCYCGSPSYRFECVEDCIGVNPFTKTYDKEPYYCGYFNSLIRVKNWLEKRIAYLDSVYNYK